MQRLSRSSLPISLTLTLLGMAIIIGLLLSIIWTRPGQISQASADQICKDFYTDVQSQITGIDGYRIDRGAKNCNPITDEMGSTDYSLGVHFKILRVQDSREAVDKNELDQLVREVPTKNYPIFIGNMQNGELAICLSASRYIDNDGKDYPQEGAPNGPNAQFVKPGSINGFSPCEDL